MKQVTPFRLDYWRSGGMKAFNITELRVIIIEAIRDIFRQMLSAELELLERDDSFKELGDGFVSSVGFAGDVSGVISMQVKECAARMFTSTILDVEPYELNGTEEIRDVIGELGNMLGGRVKSRFCDSGLPCVLSIPSVTHGRHFKTLPVKGTTEESFLFRHKKNVIKVKISLRAEC